MILKSFEMGFPVLELKSLIMHHTPRPATAFERIILKMLISSVYKGPHAELPLSTIFERILCVPLPETMALPALENLLDLNFIVSEAPLESLAAIRLSDLKITSEGRNVSKDFILPAKTYEDIVTHYFDPISGALYKSPSGASTNKPSISCNEESFFNTYPEQLLMEQIPKEEHQWLQPSTVINSISKRSTKILWRMEMVRLVADDEGRISFDAKPEKIRDYLSKIEPTEARGQILDKLFQKNDGEAGAKTAEWHSVNKKIKDILNSGTTNLQAKAPDVKSGIFLLPSGGIIRHSEPIPGKALIFSALPGASLLIQSVKWNTKMNGALVNIECPPGEFGLPVWAEKGGTNAFRSVFSFDYAGEQFPVELAFSIINSEMADIWDSLVGLLASSKDLEQLSVLFIMLPAETAWGTVLKSFDFDRQTGMETLNNLIKIRSIFIRNNDGRGTAPKEFGMTFSKIFCRLVDEIFPMTYEKAEKLATLYANAALETGKPKDNMASSLLEKLAMPESCADLISLEKLFKKLSLTMPPPPSKYHPSSIILEVLDAFDSEKSFESTSLSGSELGKAVKSLGQADKAIRRTITTYSIDCSSPNLGGLKSQVHTIIGNSLEKWEEAFSLTKIAVQHCGIDFPKTRIIKVYNEIGKLRKALAEIEKQIQTKEQKDRQQKKAKYSKIISETSKDSILNKCEEDKGQNKIVTAIVQDVRGQSISKQTGRKSRRR